MMCIAAAIGQGVGRGSDIMKHDSLHEILEGKIIPIMTGRVLTLHFLKTYF